MAEAKESSDHELEQLQFKVIILGDGAVGKTSIAMRHTENTFSNVYKQTIGLDFYLKRLSLPGDVQVALQLWDIGGQTIGGKMLKNYIFGAHAVLLVYDITNYESFQNLEDWLRLVQRTFGDSKLPYIGLCGNKNDLNHLRTVKAAKHKQFADENEMKSYMLSAKTGDQVNSTFFQIAADLAGVIVTRPEVETITPIVKATIINHDQNDPEVNAPDMRRPDKKCSIQ
ncbi:ras family GTPase [Thraustotheca clavata]|uniref:Ras family GTPase n=1 Tax=Thraustotheca clavata TaxID=74557 RepID=A0A1V9ZZ47_9STRA|nr:ras family GTPase [Thraustotheca clavata]